MDSTATCSPGSVSDERVDLSPMEESLVADDRAGLTPSEMVERKLVALLKSNPLPVSQLNSGRRLLRR
jgi:hypothetical protein